MIMSKMIYLFSAVLFLLLSFSAGLSLENLSSRQSLSSSKPYSTDRLLHELKDQMQNGRGAGVNLAEAQLSSKKKKSSNDLTVYMPKSESKEDSYSSGNGYYGNEESLGPAWDPLYSYNDLHSFRADVKRNKRARKEEQAGNNQELADILKDDENGGKSMERERKVPPDVKRQESHHGKKKRQSDDPPMPNLKDLKDLKDLNSNPEQQQSPDFQDWLRKEYYRNMARSFASMRRKRAGWGPLEAHNNDSRPPTSGHRRIAKQAGPSPSSQTKGDRFEEVTDNLKNIEDALLSDALRIINENGGDYAEDDFKRNRITNDLNAAYDLETMRAALLHLKETLSNMEDDDDDDMEGAEYPIYGNYRKRGDQCPPLDLLTSDCSALSDVAEGPLKQLLLASCNWHEVCYTCGEAFGLTSDKCDVGFVEQSQTFCRGDVPCQTTAGLLLLPLRQRRVFYKRSNPSVCFVDPCVEEFLTQG